MQFGVIVARQRRQDAQRIFIGVVSAIGANRVPKIMIFVSKSSNVKEVIVELIDFQSNKISNIHVQFCLASVTITRDCLSTLNSGYRTDLPADRYEGCRPAAKDVRLAHYVFNNTIKELDIRRDYFDSTMFCYCFLDHRCNGSTSINASIWSCVAGLVIVLVAAVRLF